MLSARTGHWIDSTLNKHSIHPAPHGQLIACLLFAMMRSLDLWLVLLQTGDHSVAMLILAQGGAGFQKSLTIQKSTLAEWGERILAIALVPCYICMVIMILVNVPQSTS